MTIWWSKATRLLEFSRSKFAPRHEAEVGSGWLLEKRGSPERDGEEGEEEGEGLVLEYSSSWIVCIQTSKWIIIGQYLTWVLDKTFGPYENVGIAENFVKFEF